MFAVVAIAPNGGEMIASVHDTEAEAAAEVERQAELRGGVWSFVVRKVVVD